MLSQFQTPAGRHACKFKHVHTLFLWALLSVLLPFPGYHACFSREQGQSGRKHLAVFDLQLSLMFIIVQTILILTGLLQPDRVAAHLVFIPNTALSWTDTQPTCVCNFTDETRKNSSSSRRKNKRTLRDLEVWSRAPPASPRRLSDPVYV